MILFQKPRCHPLQTGTVHAQVKRSLQSPLKMRSLLRKLVAMLVAMGIGMALFYLLVLLMRISPAYSALLEPETDLYAIGMAVFMTVPTWLVAQCENHDRNTGACENY